MAIIVWKTEYNGAGTYIGVKLPSNGVVCRWCITQEENDEDDVRGEKPVVLQVGNLTCSRCKRPLMAPNPITGEMDHLYAPPPIKKGR